MNKLKLLLCSISLIILASPAYAAKAVGTETVLNKVFGVNLHMENCCKGNYGNTKKVISEIKYIGARRLRDWATTDNIVNEWRAINAATGARFHVSIPQTSPAGQRTAFARTQKWLKLYPGLIDVIEGGNEPDAPYSVSQGATLEDTALLQHDVYKAGRKAGVKVAQMSVGAGWHPPLYEGNYKKFGKPPADYGNAHAYMNPNEPPSSNLTRIGKLAAYSVDGKPVDVTEFGIYQNLKQDDGLTSAYMHQAPFDAYLLGCSGFFIYALHDDISNVVSFYDSTGNARAFADYWHFTTQLLSDPKGKKLPAKDMDVTFSNQKTTGSGTLGIKNILMYKSDGSIWIATYDEERAGAGDGFQTITFDKTYKTVQIFDGQDGEIIQEFNDVEGMDITMPPNHIYLIRASDNRKAK
jgi:hypothetical protein